MIGCVARVPICAAQQIMARLHEPSNLSAQACSIRNVMTLSPFGHLGKQLLTKLPSAWNLS